MTKWCHCEEHDVDYPCDDKCQYCEIENNTGNLPNLTMTDNPSRRLRPLRRNKDEQKS